MTFTEGLVSAAVEMDIRSGIGSAPDPYFELGKFELVPLANGRSMALDLDHEVATVQWQIQAFDNMGIRTQFPTGKPVLIRGVHVVCIRNGQVVFHRHVDWNFVNSQLGGSRGRTSTHERRETAKDRATHDEEVRRRSVLSDDTGAGDLPG